MNAPSLSPRPTHLPADAQLLKRGERVLEPDVYLAAYGDQPVVVKDYRRYRGTPLALAARWLVRHEAGILRRLSGWRHAPALIGMGALALGMEFIPGTTLSEIGLSDSASAVGQEVFDQLQAALHKLHAQGITHNDLHGANVVVSAGVPVLIDFTSAWRTPRLLQRSFLSRQLRRGDWKNLLKLRQRATGIEPTREQAARVAEPRWVRSIRDGWKYFYRGGKQAAGN
ncbi:MAG: RIO1 family regulatory kinase/ATPase [Pseudoxanthomonas sp.]